MIGLVVSWFGLVWFINKVPSQLPMHAMGGEKKNLTLTSASNEARYVIERYTDHLFLRTH